MWIRYQFHVLMSLLKRSFVKKNSSRFTFLTISKSSNFKGFNFLLVTRFICRSVSVRRWSTPEMWRLMMMRKMRIFNLFIWKNFLFVNSHLCSQRCSVWSFWMIDYWFCAAGFDESAIRSKFDVRLFLHISRGKTLLPMLKPLKITKFPWLSYFWNDFGTINPLWSTKTAINYRDHILLRPIWTKRETKVITLSDFFIKIGPYQWFSVLMGQMSAIRNMTKLQFFELPSLLFWNPT